MTYTGLPDRNGFAIGVQRRDSQAAVCVLFPTDRDRHGSAGYPTSGGSAHGWFSLSRCEFGTIVVVDVRGGPVVVAIHANVDGRAYSAFEVQAEEMLRSVTLGP